MPKHKIIMIAKSVLILFIDGILALS